MEIKIVKSVKDDFSETSGPTNVTHAFLFIDGMLFELGRFYEGPYMHPDTSKRLEKLLEFERELTTLVKWEEIDKTIKTARKVYAECSAELDAINYIYQCFEAEKKR